MSNNIFSKSRPSYFIDLHCVWIVLFPTQWLTGAIFSHTHIYTMHAHTHMPLKTNQTTIVMTFIWDKEKSIHFDLQNHFIYGSVIKKYRETFICSFTVKDKFYCRNPNSSPAKGSSRTFENTTTNLMLIRMEANSLIIFAETSKHHIMWHTTGRYCYTLGDPNKPVWDTAGGTRVNI